MIHLLKYSIRWAYEISNDKIVGQRHKLKILSILPVFMALEVLYEEKYISIKSSCYAPVICSPGPLGAAE